MCESNDDRIISTAGLCEFLEVEAQMDDNGECPLSASYHRAAADKIKRLVEAAEQAAEAIENRHFVGNSGLKYAKVLRMAVNE